VNEDEMQNDGFSMAHGHFIYISSCVHNNDRQICMLYSDGRKEKRELDTTE
jgi:hypothetical protein